MKTVQFNELFEKDADGYFINKVAVDLPGQVRASAGTRFSGHLGDEANAIAALEGGPVRVDILDEEGEQVYRILGNK